MNIIMIGAQGSGKGTQAELLARSLNLVHVSSGDLFRKAFAEKTELGLQAQTFIDKGELVPDHLTVEMILNRLQELEATPGVLLDGFPRTISQAQALDEGLQSIGQQADIAVYLKVPREELLRRLSGRYICRDHQHVYHMQSRPPKVLGICDIDGSPLYQRTDDRGEAVQKRLDIFFNETIHLLDYYGIQGKLIEVNGHQNINQVHAALMDEINHHLELINTYGMARIPALYTPSSSRLMPYQR